MFWQRYKFRSDLHPHSRPTLPSKKTGDRVRTGGNSTNPAAHPRPCSGTGPVWTGSKNSSTCQSSSGGCFPVTPFLFNSQNKIHPELRPPSHSWINWGLKRYWDSCEVFLVGSLGAKIWTEGWLSSKVLKVLQLLKTAAEWFLLSALNHLTKHTSPWSPSFQKPGEGRGEEREGGREETETGELKKTEQCCTCRKQNSAPRGPPPAVPHHSDLPGLQPHFCLQPLPEKGSSTNQSLSISSEEWKSTHSCSRKTGSASGLFKKTGK